MILGCLRDTITDRQQGYLMPRLDARPCAIPIDTGGGAIDAILEEAHGSTALGAEVQ